MPSTVEGKTDVLVSRTADLLRRFRPGQNIDAELAAYEAAQRRRPDEPAASRAGGPAEPEPGRRSPPRRQSDGGAGRRDARPRSRR